MAAACAYCGQPTQSFQEGGGPHNRWCGSCDPSTEDD